MFSILHKMFAYEYISKEHLTGLDRYKYSSVDTSPLSKYVMHPFWNRVVEIYPRWLAPNLITLTGFMCLIFEFVLFSIYDYGFYGYCFDRADCADDASRQLNLSLRQHSYQASVRQFEQPANNVCSCVPRWLWLVLAVCQFLSHHLDGTDGKQARRTGSSSPLGELFDHGLDSWATLFLPVAIFSVFGRNEPYGSSVMSFYAILWLIMGVFIISHWEKYNTGILYLPWSYDLSQMGMTVLFFATFLFGQQFWLQNLFGVSLSRLIEVAIHVFSLGFTLPASSYNVYLAYKSKTMKQKSVYEGVRPIFSTLYLFGVQLVWLNYSRVNIIELEPRMFLWLTGTLFSNISCRLIVAQMTSTRCEIFNWVLVPLTLVVALFSFDLSVALRPFLTGQQEVNALYLMATLATLSHVHYGICMVRQICKHLNIYCFVITSRPTNAKTVETASDDAAAAATGVAASKNK